MFSWSQARQNGRFPPPWRVEKADSSFIVRDANGIPLAVVHYWDGLGQWTFASKHLTEDEARRIARAMTRLPEFLMQRHGFYPRGGGDRWKPADPTMSGLRTATFARIGARSMRSASSTASRSTRRARRFATAACGTFTNLLGSLTRFYFGTGLRDAGCTEANFIIPSARRTCANEAAQELAEVRPAKSKGMNPLCNLYLITTNQEAIFRPFRVLYNTIGNKPTSSAVFPDWEAPVVATARTANAK
jgi:hypothetical protein